MPERFSTSAPVDGGVVVVGAGLSGMTAARELIRAGLSVVVLEADDRIGGRVRGVPIGEGETVEIGGQYVGPDQDSILALADELGVGRYPAHMVGDHMHYTANGSIMRIVGGRDRASTYRFLGGAQRIAEGLAGELAGSIRLNSPVRRIIRSGDEVIAQTDTAAIRARRALVAIPPPFAAEIEFIPDVVRERAALAVRSHSTTQIKANIVYARPFWRANGLSGCVLSEQGQFRNIWDNTPASGRPGVLAGFITGDAAAALDDAGDAQLRRVIVDDLVRYFGEDAARPREVLFHRWRQEPWIQGCSGSLAHLGVTHPRTIRRPGRLVHWAGTETAECWQGHMDGAVSAGSRAAREIALVLGATAR
ncbi:flavin monoamine oxidase family protein [Nocardia sp. NPDC051570]|uniref:flavin monoamine oxidase family protein n=1 Tax=Nocardia sp. NPDC051570 TaxID=3364324 RepID=UPI003796D072